MDNSEMLESEVIEMMELSFEIMRTKIKKVLKSGAVDVSGWDANYNSMLLPKAILIAILEDEADQYKGQGTSFEKQIKKDVKNIKNYV